MNNTPDPTPTAQAAGSDLYGYGSRCCTFGRIDGQKPGFLTWWYSPNEALGGRSPREAVDAGDLPKVEDLWDNRPKHPAERRRNRAMNTPKPETPSALAAGSDGYRPLRDGDRILEVDEFWDEDSGEFMPLNACASISARWMVGVSYSSNVFVRARRLITPSPNAKPSVGTPNP